MELINSGEGQGGPTGPQIGPGLTNPSIPPPVAAGLPTPNGGTAYSGATISAGPTGPTQKEYISASYEPAPSAPTIHPSRMAQMGSGPPPVAGQTHARDDEEAAERPVFKRPKIDKLPYGQFYSVCHLLSMISIICPYGLYHPYQ